MKQVLTVGTLAAAFGLAPQARAVSVNMLTNPGFEDDDASVGDFYGPTGYGVFGDAFVTRGVTPRTGDQTLKLFGPFFNGGGAGVTQLFPANPGETWEASAWARNDSADAIGTNNFGVVQVKFLDSDNNDLSVTDSAQINASSPADTWVKLTAQATAPEGTANALFVIVHVQQDPITGGAAFFDDAAFGLVTALPGDTDGDGDVDDSDLGNSFANYTGPVGDAGGKTTSQGDTDGDGDVDDSDLGNSFAGYTGPLGPAAVPEPTSLALIGLGGLALARRRRA